MAYSVFVLLALAAAGAVALRLAQVSRLRRISLQLLGAETAQADMAAPQGAAETSDTFPPRYPWAAPVAGVFVAGLILAFTLLPKAYAVAGGIQVAVVTYLVELYWSDARVQRMEIQLADAIDQMVSTLRAGSALLAAFDSVLREARPPIAPELEDLVARIRLGEDPNQAVRHLSLRVPLESFRLFCHSLQVHWETGGSLTRSLRTVGSTIRDRIEVSRRINAQAIEAQASVVAVMAIAYGLVILMWNTNPGPIQKLLYSSFGSYIAAGVMILQAIGMVWIWRMSRIRF